MSLRAIQNSLDLILNRIEWEVIPSSRLIRQFSTLFKTSSSEIKVIALVLIWFIIWSPVAFLISRKIKWKPFEPLNSNQKLLLLAPLYTLAPVLIFLISILEQKSLIDYGLVFNCDYLTDFLLGLLIRS